jgi:hypothetical protein
MIETIKDTSTGKLNINSKKNIYIPNKIEYEENNNVSLDDIFDKYIEQKELYEPVKIYEIKNIKKISFGLQTSGYSLPE